MRFMLVQTYGASATVDAPILSWRPEDVRAHIAFQEDLNARLAELGELIDAVGLARPEDARYVVSDGTGAPVVTDGPYAEAKELLAGYRIIDVDTWDRAVQIAALVSAAPGPGGVPLGVRIEVRPVAEAPPEV